MTARQRVAVVTGASSGIGKEVARALAMQGWRVIGTGRDPARMAEAEKEIATAEESGRSSGGYWEKRAPRQPHAHVDDPAAVARFWRESEKLAGSVRTGA